MTICVVFFLSYSSVVLKLRKITGRTISPNRSVSVCVCVYFFLLRFKQKTSTFHLHFTQTTHTCSQAIILIQK